MKEMLETNIVGHCLIEDDLGNVLLDQCNAVHPQNVARVFGRALANENNFAIYRMAFGNGGTVVDAARTITYRQPNDGQPPDNSTWESRLYNETFSKIVDEGNIEFNALMGTDPGSVDHNGVRHGGGAIPTPADSVEIHRSGPGVRSRELGLQTEVVVTCTIGKGEPFGQFEDDRRAPYEDTETEFVFDEIGLYTDGSPAASTPGYLQFDVSDRQTTDDTGLLPGVEYGFRIYVDDNEDGTFKDSRVVWFKTPAEGGSGIAGQILYGDLCEAINTGDPRWRVPGDDSGLFYGTGSALGGAKMIITDGTGGLFPSVVGENTYGFLTLESTTTGVLSRIMVEKLRETDLAHGTADYLFDALNPPVGAVLHGSVQGRRVGDRNNPVNSTRERERLLTHLITSPVLKARNRTLTVTYTLTISVARSRH